MNHYQSPGSRAALGLAALAMSAVTLVLLVVVPARIDVQAPVVLTAMAQTDRAGGDTAPLALHVRETE